MSEPRMGVLDLRTYKLVPDAGGEFDRLFTGGALPMLQRYGIEVVGYGASLEDADVYYLIRAFPSVTLRERQLEAFYGSAEWRDNHRNAVLGLIETYHTAVIELARITLPSKYASRFESLFPDAQRAKDPVPALVTFRLGGVNRSRRA